MELSNPKIFWGSLLVIAGVTYVSADFCVSSGLSHIDLFLPHEKYCNLFYRLDRCPDGLVYNPTKQQCDFPKSTSCGSKLILTTTSGQGGGKPGTGGQGGGEAGDGGQGEGDNGSRPDYPIVEGGYSFIGGACPSREVCPQQQDPNQRLFLPHSTSCNLFCGCQKGTPLLYICDPGYLFNPRKKRCESPSHNTCLNDENELPHSTEFPPISRIEIWRRPILVEGECRPKGKCPQNGNSLLPHETACNLLCGCKNGKSILYRCPRGLYYNDVSKQCDYPENSICNPGGSGDDPSTHTSEYKTTNPTNSANLGGSCISSVKCPSNIPSGSSVYLPHLSVCNLFCGCHGNAIQLYACSKGLHFNPKTQECVSPNEAKCDPIPPHKTNPTLISTNVGNGDCNAIQTCPANDPSDFTIYLPHVTDCRYFCRCDHGMAKLQECGKGLHFNPKKHSCDVPNGQICTTTVANTDVLPTQRSVEETTARNDGNTITGGQNQLCPAEGLCSTTKTEYLPHQRSCNLFCECTNGIPRLRSCPEGLHFNPRNKKCETPDKALCQGACHKLEHRNATIWSPNTCTSRLSKIGDTCSVKCAKGFELRGKLVLKCTINGWEGTEKQENLPSCKAPEEVGKDIIDNVEQQAKGKVNFLFLLDESLSLTKEEFASEISFIKAIVSQFPLSGNRTAGVISFSGSAAVDVHMTVTESCNFFKSTDRIVYAGGSTDINKALRVALQELNTNSATTRTLVFLITDGRSETNPTAAANEIKKRNHVLFTIGIGEYDRKELEPLATPGSDGVPLFFGLTNFKAFNKIAEYLHTVHGYGVNLNCYIPEISV